MQCEEGGMQKGEGGKARFSPQLPTQPDTLSVTPSVQQYRIRYCIRLSVRPSVQEYYTYNANPFVSVLKASQIVLDSRNHCK